MYSTSKINNQYLFQWCKFVSFGHFLWRLHVPLTSIYFCLLCRCTQQLMLWPNCKLELNRNNMNCPTFRCKAHFLSLVENIFLILVCLISFIKEKSLTAQELTKILMGWTWKHLEQLTSDLAIWVTLPSSSQHIWSKICNSLSYQDKFYRKCQWFWKFFPLPNGAGFGDELIQKVQVVLKQAREIKANELVQQCFQELN
jgi:hypothetical protein